MHYFICLQTYVDQFVYGSCLLALIDLQNLRVHTSPVYFCDYHTHVQEEDRSVEIKGFLECFDLFLLRFMFFLVFCWIFDGLRLIVLPTFQYFVSKAKVVMLNIFFNFLFLVNDGHVILTTFFKCWRSLSYKLREKFQLHKSMTWFCRSFCTKYTPFSGFRSYCWLQDDLLSLMSSFLIRLVS